MEMLLVAMNAPCRKSAGIQFIPNDGLPLANLLLSTALYIQPRFAYLQVLAACKGAKPLTADVSFLSHLAGQRENYNSSPVTLLYLQEPLAENHKWNILVFC